MGTAEAENQGRRRQVPLETQRASGLHVFRFLRAIAECFARLSHGLGVCLSVCPSVTLCDCIKTV